MTDTVYRSGRRVSRDFGDIFIFAHPQKAQAVTRSADCVYLRASKEEAKNTAGKGRDSQGN